MASLEKISLYVTEDYYLTRMTYIRNLRQAEDFSILGDFASAEECIEALKIKCPNVILMDLGLPGMNGIEATQIISDKYPHVKIIILTSHESREEMLACTASGANGYILKDVPFETIKRVIRMVNMGAMWFDPRFPNITKHTLPKPDSTDFGNLYEKGICSKLTQKEHQVLELLSKGYSNTQIGKMISISSNTVKAHVGSIFNKLHVKDRVQAAGKAARSKSYTAFIEVS